VARAAVAIGREPPSHAGCLRVVRGAGIDFRDARIEELVLEPEGIDAGQARNVESRKIAEVFSFG
jgi:hypothetical protein